MILLDLSLIRYLLCQLYKMATLFYLKDFLFQTILAHGIFLKPEELSVLKAKGTTISHCPNSNSMLQSGLCPVRKYLDFGLKVSLGTDCAGGFSASMLDAIRQALQASVNATFTGGGSKLSHSEVFYLATLAGAEGEALVQKT